MKIINNVPVWGDPDEQSVEQLQRCMEPEDCMGGALMADHHLGYSMPIGGVVKYEHHISPSGVGYDIACVDKDTEYLSDSGWRKMSEYDGGKVLQYNVENGIAEFVDPAAYIVVDCPMFLHFKTKFGVDQMVTPDHKMIVWRNIGGRGYSTEPSISVAQDLADEHNRLKLGLFANFETSFTLSNTMGGIPLTDNQLRVQVMAMADGHLSYNKMVVSLKREDKIKRTEMLLTNADIAFTKNVNSNNGYTTFRFTPPIRTKVYGPIFWLCSSNQLLVIGQECLLWDGSSFPKTFYSSIKESANFIHYVFAASGYRSVMRMDERKDGSLEYRVFGYDKSTVGMRSTAKRDVLEVDSEDGKAYCFTVPSGFFITRRGGNIVVTGNCGNMAVRTNIYMHDEPSPLVINPIMERIQETISFGIGRSNKDTSVESHAIFDNPVWQDFKPVLSLKRKAADQLGTVGSGNHYVDLLVDDEGFLWVANHFGSRGLGHSIATGFLKLAQGKSWDDKPGNDSMDAPPTLIDTRTELGQAYITYMNLAGEYAYAGREYVIRQVLDILGNPEVTDSVHVHHNFAWYEDGGWVVRKGATPLYPGDRAFIGGSMGGASAIVRGQTNGVSVPSGTSVILTGDMNAISGYQNSLNSAPHGAGRIMSRTKAAGKFKKITTTYGKKIRVRSGGLVTPDMMREATQGVVVLGGGTDESPHVYKQLPEVLQAHPYVEIEHWLRPIGVVMAGENEFDPYVD